MDDQQKLITALVQNTEHSFTTNVSESYITTTEDKVQILYNDYNGVVRTSGNTLGLLGVFITLIISDLTCNYHSVLMIDKSVVQAVFYLATVIFFILTIRSGYSWFRNRSRLRFQYFVNQLKGSNSDYTHKD